MHLFLNQYSHKTLEAPENVAILADGVRWLSQSDCTY